MNLESSKKLSVLYHDKTGDKGIGMKGAPGLKGDQGMKGDMGKTLRLYYIDLHCISKVCDLMSRESQELNPIICALHHVKTGDKGMKGMTGDKGDKGMKGMVGDKGKYLRLDI